jgi:UrcA family protein
MNKRTFVSQSLPVALLATAFAISSSAVCGQESTTKQEVQINTGQIVTVKQGTRQAEALQLSKKVSLADLDLTTTSGTTELENRIRDTANSICDHLMDVDPSTSAPSELADRRDCVDNAVHGAMTHARQLIALAEQAKRRG